MAMATIKRLCYFVSEKLLLVVSFEIDRNHVCVRAFQVRFLYLPYIGHVLGQVAQ